MARVLRSLITVDGMWDLRQIIANGTNVFLVVRLTVIQERYPGWMKQKRQLDSEVLQNMCVYVSQIMSLWG